MTIPIAYSIWVAGAALVLLKCIRSVNREERYFAMLNVDMVCMILGPIGVVILLLESGHKRWKSWRNRGRNGGKSFNF